MGDWKWEMKERRLGIPDSDGGERWQDNGNGASNSTKVTWPGLLKTELARRSLRPTRRDPRPGVFMGKIRPMLGDSSQRASRLSGFSASARLLQRR